MDVYYIFLITFIPGYKPLRAKGHEKLPPQYDLESLQKTLQEQHVENISENLESDLVIFFICIA